MFFGEQNFHEKLKNLIEVRILIFTSKMNVSVQGIRM